MYISEHNQTRILAAQDASQGNLETSLDRTEKEVQLSMP